MGWIGRLKARGTLIVYSVVFATALAAIADLIGLATIIGAFAAGLVLATTERREHIEDRKGVCRWPVGVGMVPRGEGGLIFAGTGLSARVIAEDLYSALVVVVMLTTFVAPPWLKALYSTPKGPSCSV